ncbi:MAG TPA: hypothetical protein VGX03_28995 [Candidatus Binatia bacterium]|nr:hypothetical protein [Candidatus Binatia bacterium]
MVPQEQPAPPVKILLVDDTPSTLFTLESSLTDRGQHLLKAPSAYEALWQLLHQILLSRIKEKSHFG